ncbi:sugar phosphate isomerase/epimerase [Paludisphaera sp.]|uniref:sugar phosphate isomerase/epimerase family protein n=1 Tax=Paludisphaera sp. TaxID=2017432 RepID=UPI00301D711D
MTTTLSRRGFLAGGLAAAGALAVGRHALAASAAPFRLGLQSYSLRGYREGDKSSVEKALAVSHKLGVRNWEAYPGHLPVTADEAAIAGYKKLLGDAEVQVVGYGVVPIKKGSPENRKYFDFAKAMGIEYLAIDPDPDAFDDLDKLVDEFQIGAGIHNHGPGHRYEFIDDIAKAIAHHSRLVGCCIDCGHFLRSREDPIRAAEVFAGRVFGIHLKDVKDAKHFTILGQGDLNTPGLFKTLKSQGYKSLVALEYEENEQDPADDIRACLEEVQKAVDSL